MGLRWFTLGLLFAFVFSAGAAQGGEPEATLKSARKLLDEGRPDSALVLFQSLLDAQQYYMIATLGVARAHAALNRPEWALAYYRAAARDLSASTEDRRVARFGAARMHLWLEDYTEAEQYYRALLRDSLSAADRAEAQAGLCASLALQDHTQSAYALFADSLPAGDRARFEQARAALWSGWPDRAVRIIQTGVSFPAGSRAACELSHLTRDLQAALGNRLEGGYALRYDDDELVHQSGTFWAGRRLRPHHAPALGFGFTRLHQQDRDTIWYRLLGRLDTRLGERIWLHVEGGPTWLHDWNHAAGFGRLIYRPSDTTAVVAEVHHEQIATFPALSDHLTLTDLTLRIDRLLSRRVKLALGGGGTAFSDDNWRTRLFGELTATFPRSNGVRLRLQSRFFSDSRPGSPAYFDAERLFETRLLIDLRRGISRNWRWWFTAGPGLQTIVPGDRNVTLLLDAGLRGYMGRRWFAELSLGYSNSATATPSGFESVQARLTLNSSW